MISFYLQRLVEIFPFFLKGLWMTVIVAGSGLVFGTICGFLLGILRAGKNELKMIVTNTLANQFVTTKHLDRWPANVIGPYHGIGKFFEQDSLASGLFGPVKILA